MTTLLPVRENPPIDKRPYQPFQCDICQRRFTRHENLKRHAALHSQSSNTPSLQCTFCDITFSRSDLRRRHIQRKHLDARLDARGTRASIASPPPAQRQEKNARRQTLRKELSESPSQMQVQMSPTNGVDQHGHGQVEVGGWSRNTEQRMLQQSQSQSQVQTQSQPRSHSLIYQGLAAKSVEETSLLAILMDDDLQNQTQVTPDLDIEAATSFISTNHLGSSAAFKPPSPTNSIPMTASWPGLNLDQDMLDTLFSVSPPCTTESWFPSRTQLKQGCELYFDHVSHFLPFLHRPTFDIDQVPKHLLLSILCLGYQYGEDPDSNHQSRSSDSISRRCFDQALVSISREKDNEHNEANDLVQVQSFLLLQIYAMLYAHRNESACGLRTHSKMIALARSGGLLQPSQAQRPQTSDLDSLWLEFARAESRKRTLYAIHQIDTHWYQFLSIPRSLSHLEIKHDLPCPEAAWAASTAGEWAHHQLTAGHAGSCAKYPVAIRHFLSSDKEDINYIPDFSSYGAINITHFLVSSAREISGWSAMTGILSTERLDPLRSSLSALGPYIRAQNAHFSLSNSRAASAAAAASEATWETAMIEVQVWSPSHTGGIVETEIASALHRMHSTTPSADLLSRTSLATGIQPHINWFLIYLATETNPECEAPWVTLSAYKAFMLAWQLVKGGVPGAMEVVQIDEGDTEGAVRWAREVFGRRARWRIGKVILECLDELR